MDARGIGRRTFRHFFVSAVGKCFGDNFGVLSPVLTFRYNLNPFGVKDKDKDKDKDSLLAQKTSGMCMAMLQHVHTKSSNYIFN